MASFRRQKEALRIAIFSYYAGAHHITEEVEKNLSIKAGGNTQDAIEMRHAMLEADYERLRESHQSLEMFIDVLEEEDLYPFGSEWPREALAELGIKLKPPALSLDTGETDNKFRFKKGFKELLNAIASSLETELSRPNSMDHWMVLLLNTAFHAGAVAAARNAENPKLYYEVMPELEAETEPWTKYPQLADLLDKQLRRETRRKTGLVSDLDY